MQYLRTPDQCFEQLPDFAYTPNYVHVDDQEGGQLRLHYIDEGERDGRVVLMLHGEPSWSFLYRKMIEPLVAAGYRVIVPDLIGFGRSDKPTQQSDYSHARHVAWIKSLLDQLGLQDMVLVCQDWGGLIGLRLLADQPDRFAGVLAANTMLPAFPIRHPALKHFGRLKQLRATLGFGSWFLFSQIHPRWTAGMVLGMGTAKRLPAQVRAAYDAPFPSLDYMAGARVFPKLVPSDMAANKVAWRALIQYERPFLCAFSDKDLIMSAMSDIFPSLIKGCQGQAHTTIQGGGHFLQEDCGEALADVLLGFLHSNGLHPI
jgi:haloalkane dehalogenase